VRGIKLAVFDMDGLIFDSETAFMEELKIVMAEHGYTLTEEIYKSTLGLNGKKLKEIMAHHFGEDYPIFEMAKLARKGVTKRAEEGRLGVKKGIIELLEYLYEKDIPMVVASSSFSEFIDMYLKYAGLRKYFKTITGGEEVPVSKPEPDIFIKACEKENISRENAVVFEDSPNGVNAALKAGIFTICMPDMVKVDDETVKKAGVFAADGFEAIEILKNIIENKEN